MLLQQLIIKRLNKSILTIIYKFRKTLMKNTIHILVVCFTAAISLSPSKSYAQNMPMLAKEWNGTLTLTSIGATSIHNPTHKKNRDDGKDTPLNWNSYVQPRKVLITKQEGRHVEFTVRGPKVDSYWIGTLSADGKEIAYASKHGSGLAKIEGDRMTGCGTSRGIDGNFEHWLNHYAAWCWEFTSAK